MSRDPPSPGLPMGNDAMLDMEREEVLSLLDNKQAGSSQSRSPYNRSTPSTPTMDQSSLYNNDSLQNPASKLHRRGSYDAAFNPADFGTRMSSGSSNDRHSEYQFSGILPSSASGNLLGKQASQSERPSGGSTLDRSQSLALPHDPNPVMLGKGHIVDMSNAYSKPRPPRKLSHSDYIIGWICPLEIGQVAAWEMLDEKHQTLPQSPEDCNSYILGSICGHNVVIARPDGPENYGARSSISMMRMTFSNVQFGLLVGIGGGVPVATEEGMIRLGHVVVSNPSGHNSGIIQYDLRKAKHGRLEPTARFTPPPAAFLGAAHALLAHRERLDFDPVWQDMKRVQDSRQQLLHFQFPGVEGDHLYPTDYAHSQPRVDFPERRITASIDDDDDQDDHDAERTPFVVVHRGTIASAEVVIKNAALRDQLAKQHGILCFDMAIASAPLDFPCMAILGISDYCDSHQSSQWHGFAAAAAAAFARQLLIHLPTAEFSGELNETPLMFDLNRDVDAAQLGVTSTPKDHPDRADRLAQLGTALLHRFSRTGRVKDLEHAVSAMNTAIDITPGDHPDRAGWLNTLEPWTGSPVKTTGSGGSPSLAELTSTIPSMPSATPFCLSSTNDATTNSMSNTSVPSHSIQQSGQMVPISMRPASPSRESIYTSTNILAPTEFIHRLSISIFNDLFSEFPNESTVEDVCKTLPHSLRSFAQKIGGENEDVVFSTPVMKFVHKNRNLISREFKAYFHDQKQKNNDEESRKHRILEDMSAGEKFALWQEKMTQTQDAPEVDDSNDRPYDMSSDDSDSFFDGADPFEDPTAAKYNTAVVKSVAYKWLISNLLADLKRQTPETSLAKTAASMKLEKMVFSRQEFREVSSKKGPPRLSASYRLDWNPSDFVEGYSEDPCTALEGAITIMDNGEGIAEAVPCQEYVTRTWPLLGFHLLDLIKQIMISKPGEECSCILFDKTQLKAWFDFKWGEFCLDSQHGIPTTLIEVGEILSWFCVALRTSTHQNPAMARPVISFDDEIEKNSFRVSIGCGWIQRVDHYPGQCWKCLFGNSAIALGFPVRRRDSDLHNRHFQNQVQENKGHQTQHGQLGLEIHLGTLAALLETGRLSIFRNRLYLKGFCTALVPTKFDGGIVYWHAFFNEDGSRISCRDSRFLALEDESKGWNIRDHLSLAEIEAARHVVGWCANIRDYVGSAEASYDVKGTTLKAPASGFAFDRISISGGKLISFGASAVIGRKDRPVRRGRESDFFKQLEWVEQRFVIFYDTKDNRAWLVNGASALLHLARASILHRRNMGYPVIFQDEDIEDANVIFGGKIAARTVLMSPHNLALKVYQNPERVTEKTTQTRSGTIETVTERQLTWTHLSDKIGDIYHVLWNIFDHQMDELSRDGIGGRVRMSPRRQLEGFDFADVARGCDPLKPKFTTLSDMGSGWVDLARSLQAITLFGEGFGELLLPASNSSLCSKWATLPKNQHLIAAVTSDLSEVLNQRQLPGEEEALCELAKDQIWHVSDKSFEDCRCDVTSAAGGGTSKLCDRVQVLLPSKFPRLLVRGLKNPPVPLPRGGAAIFGHSVAFPLIWDPKPHSMPKQAAIHSQPHDCQASRSRDDSRADSTLPGIQPESLESYGQGTTATSVAKNSGGNDERVSKRRRVLALFQKIKISDIVPGKTSKKSVATGG